MTTLFSNLQKIKEQKLNIIYNSYSLIINLFPMKIKSISLSSLQNMEHYQLVNHVLAICKEAKIEKLDTVLAALQKAFEKEDLSLNLPRKEEGTKELRELDKERSNAYRALTFAVKLNQNSEVKTNRDAAEKLSEVISRYPNLLRVNYDKKSGMIKNLVTDFSEAATFEHIKFLKIKPYIDRLSNANKTFDELYRSRLKSSIPTGTFDVKALRAETDAALNDVLRRIDSLDDLEPETPNLAELIKHYNALVEKKHFTLSHRAGTSQTARKKRTAGYAALLQPGFAQLEESLGLPSKTLSFTGKTKGTGAKRNYQLAIKGQAGLDGKPRTVWVIVDKNGRLSEVK